MKNKLFLATSFLLVFMIIIPTIPTNGVQMSQLLLNNGEFEVYDSGFTNWTIASEGSWAQVSSPSISGNSCQLTTGNSAMRSDIVTIWQQVTGQTNTHYYTSVWVYIPNTANAYARLGVRFGSNDATDYVISTVNDGWEILAYNGTSIGDTTWVQIGINCYADADASAVFYIDSAILADEAIPEFIGINITVGISFVLLLIGLRTKLIKRYVIKED